MAKKNAAATENDQAGGEGSADDSEGEDIQSSAPPAGFRALTAVNDAPWFKVKESAVCHGKLIGRYVMSNEDHRVYYQVELYQPALVTVGKGDDAEEKMAKKGTIVNLGATKTIQEALDGTVIPEILAGGSHDVYIDVKKKIKITGGKTFWLMDAFNKRVKAPTSQVVPLVQKAGNAAGEDAPF